MEVVSLWTAITKRKDHHPALTTQITADVAIIGGGITGVTTALLLSQQGKQVVLLEANEIGDGTTGNSTGNLYVLVQPYYQKIISHFNEDAAHQIIHARARAIDYIEQVVKSYQFQCNFLRRSSYLYTNEEKNISFLEKEIEILKQAGVTCRTVDQLPTALTCKKAVEITQQARINPLAYSISIADELHKQKIPIYEHTQVISIDEKTDACLIKTNQGSVLAKQVVMATHIPKGISVVDMLAVPYRSYAVAVKLKNGIEKSGHYWGINDPHYVISTHCSSVTNNIDDLLVIAGSHHKTGHDKDAIENFKILENYLRERYDIDEIRYRWSAQHYQSADGLPYIGKVSRKSNIYVATGFYADGLVYGTIAAHLVADLILEKENVLKDIVTPYRLSKPSTLMSLAEVGVEVFAQYAKDYLASSEVNSLKEIQTGESKTIKLNGEKCGAYRDKEGKLHVVSIVCTHMKCILNWNNAEITWDCPCHGSRFTVDGDVIEGPAYTNLKKIEVSESE